MGAGFVKGFLVENVGVAVEGVDATVKTYIRAIHWSLWGCDIRETGIMLQHVVAGQVVKREPGRVRLRVRADGEVKEESGDVGIEVDSVEEAVGEVIEGDVFAGTREEAVVGKGV